MRKRAKVMEVNIKNQIVTITKPKLTISIVLTVKASSAPTSCMVWPATEEAAKPNFIFSFSGKTKWRLFVFPIMPLLFFIF
jgi:hypothetical protein